jgi:SAM-dependent methyltransferase
MQSEAETPDRAGRSTPGRAGVSERLRRFVAEFPHERGSLLEFARRTASELPPGTRLLDVGAGDAPYRELFSHVEYLTSDWSESVHEGARNADIVASADALPVESASFDAVLLTQVLEHVPDPGAVLAELLRVLRPGGSLHLTAPFVWELHEMPHDYYRYTSAGLAHLLTAAGFDEVDVRPRNDSFTTIAQLLLNLEHLMGRAPDGLDEQRTQAGVALRELAERIAELAPLDTLRCLPLGYAARATRPLVGQNA